MRSSDVLRSGSGRAVGLARSLVRAGVGVAFVALAVWFAHGGTAGAEVVLEPQVVTQGRDNTVVFFVDGCQTDRIQFEYPDALTSPTLELPAGWTATTTDYSMDLTGPAAPAVLFVFRFHLDSGEQGDALFFPLTQTCGSEVIPHDDVPDGSGAPLDHPAPVVIVSVPGVTVPVTPPPQVTTQPPRPATTLTPGAAAPPSQTTPPATTPPPAVIPAPVTPAPVTPAPVTPKRPSAPQTTATPQATTTSPAPTVASTTPPVVSAPLPVTTRVTAGSTTTSTTTTVPAGRRGSVEINDGGSFPWWMVGVGGITGCGGAAALVVVGKRRREDQRVPMLGPHQRASAPAVADGEGDQPPLDAASDPNPAPFTIELPES